MSIKFLQTGHSKLAYIKFGRGPEQILCFHGYGIDKNSFRIFENKLGKQYTFYSFDLFCHGESVWHDGERALQKKEFAQVVQLFLTEEKIEKFSLFGFSMGAKSVLAVAEYFPSQVEKMILAAPDGIKTNFWYKAATYSSLLSRAFKTTIHTPEPYFYFINVMLALKIADPGVLKFISNEMNTQEKRERVYYSWMVYRNFKFDLPKIISLLNKHNVYVGFVTGLYDKIIETKMIAPYEKKFANARHKALNCGHTNLLKSFAEDEDLLLIFGLT